MNDELIKKLNDFPAFKEFQEYIITQIDKLDTLDGLEKMSNEHAGEEAKVRSKAKNTLYTILLPFTNVVEKRQPTQEEIDGAKEKFGL